LSVQFYKKIEHQQPTTNNDQQPTTTNNQQQPTTTNNNQQQWKNKNTSKGNRRLPKKDTDLRRT